jgi:hypothetical protein
LRRFWFIFLLAALLASIEAAFSQGEPQAPKYVPSAPQQPIPYSHKVHLAQGLQCANCHKMPEPGDFAELPATAVCMGCHTSIKTDSPAIKTLADYHKREEDVPWARVYRIPDYVFFSHKVHVNEGKATCETCHGPVDVMRRERDISMATCMDCHRARKASIECNFCHDPR